MIVLDYAPSLRPTLYCPLVQLPNSLFNKDLAYFRAGSRRALAQSPSRARQHCHHRVFFGSLSGDLP